MFNPVLLGLALALNRAKAGLCATQAIAFEGFSSEIIRAETLWFNIFEKMSPIAPIPKLVLLNNRFS